jgi:hypothetical protein
MAGVIVTARREATNELEDTYVLGFNPPISRAEALMLIGRRSCDLTENSEREVTEFSVLEGKFKGVAGPDSFIEFAEEVAKETGRIIYNEGAPVELMPGQCAVQAVFEGEFDIVKHLSA